MKFFAPSNIRPTSSKVREAIFHTLKSHIGSLSGLSVLDLFAGSGALGITALQNGSENCVFVDLQRLSCQAIKDNLKQSGLQNRASVICSDVLKLKLKGDRQFHLLFADPPYQLENFKLRSLFAKVGSWLAEGGIFVFEFDSKRSVELELTDLKLLFQKNYGDTVVYFLQKEFPLPSTVS